MLEKDIERVLREVYSQVTKDGRTALKEINLTPPQFNLMVHLYFCGPLNQTNLAKDLYLAKSTISGIVERLEKRRFVKRAKVEADRRSEIVVLTPNGEEVILRVIDKRVECLRRLMMDFTDEEKEKLLEFLTRMRDKLPEFSSSKKC
ncbi:MAG TPA: MarR family transcriptional regulator [Candidatus Hydrothermia bacterium]|nr:MarR family transcriptional regulator [Candidatus Hydrothermae bacterium]MDD3649620.1 MarR family transcriptional regulator [Candidatus Hydrothermia bacterium]MDD5573326.1 MarR family transcriptional regulator [Candidatus Hydrothermia bacterium]HOK23530.1 MarR family transcriptional regulator [Candidatus Hydrothermia bacterium]HOL24241.1 MarR family transcriptional regulator [Candidatus Hydrothermia bacterium]